MVLACKGQVAVIAIGLLWQMTCDDRPTDCSPSAEESNDAPKSGVAGCTFSKLSEDELGLRCHIVSDTVV